MEGRARAVVCAALGAAVAVAPVAVAAAAGPSTRYAFANRCFTAASAAGRKFVATGGTTGYRASASRRPGAMPFYFKPTVLGSYMLQDRDGKLASVGDGTAVVRGTTAGEAAEWAAAKAPGGTFTLRSSSNGGLLSVDPASGDLVTGGSGAPTRFRFGVWRGCRSYPESGLGATGRGHRGRNRDGTVFGYADAHVHITADMRAGGQTIYGESFDRFGITQALGRDADVHGPDGSLDVTGNLLRTGMATGTHNTDGWPTFAGWPVYDTYTHQQTYYRWLQRDWMAGERLVTAQLVEDQPLCMIEPRRSHSCDETATIELELAKLKGLQGYVDAQSGGPGKGWFRVVYSPAQARRAIEQGKLAVVVGVEASDPFGCSELEGQPQCDKSAIDRGIALYKRLGIRSMFVAHWIDNAFAGAALEPGDTGTFIASFEVAQTGQSFQTGPCPEAGQGDQCNSKGLTDLGAYLIGKLMDNHMLIEMDHLSERARLDVLKIAEARHYPLVSSHTNTGGFWTTSDLHRLYKLGGYAVARPDNAKPLADRILSYRRFRHDTNFLGVGLGSDTGGFNALPGPDPNAAKKPLRYPFKSYDGRVTFVCQLLGPRVVNLNKYGVADYGQFPDLIAYMSRQKGGRAAGALLFRSAEAYLQTWQRAARGR